MPTTSTTATRAEPTWSTTGRSSIGRLPRRISAEDHGRVNTHNVRSRPAGRLHYSLAGGSDIVAGNLRHFLKLRDLAPAEARALLDRAIALKRDPQTNRRPLTGRNLAMVFAKSSTRTRVSFEVGMAKLGGHAVMLPTAQTQLGREEPLADTARVLSRYCDAIMIRNDSQADQEELARHAGVPVINGLSESHHPCQLLADMQTWLEHRGDPGGKVAAWIGDGNNVCNSWIEASALFGFRLRVATPHQYRPDAAALAYAGRAVRLYDDPRAAAAGADLIVTDTFTSMGREAERAERIQILSAFQVDARTMAAAKADALFMHCLPAHRGEEVTAEVIDGPHSVVWDEAENRMWAQMALLEFLLCPAATSSPSPFA
ncbi:MAG: ornithine carbamoyltransferase [Gammaproteobacteria bacterium]|nr:ornithine carbamoyltransferase [Gammaproteobacteria bacterium]